MNNSKGKRETKETMGDKNSNFKRGEAERGEGERKGEGEGFAEDRSKSAAGSQSPPQA